MGETVRLCGRGDSPGAGLLPQHRICPGQGYRNGRSMASKGRMEPGPGAVPESQRIRRKSGIFPLSGLWRTAAILVPGGSGLALPEMRSAELSEPTGNQKRFYVLLSQGYDPDGKAPGTAAFLHRRVRLLPLGAGPAPVYAPDHI